VERFPETVDIRLGATVIRQERNPNFRAQRPDEDKAAPASLGEFRAEMVGDVQMCHRIEPQSRLKQLPIQLQELAQIWGAALETTSPMSISSVASASPTMNPSCERSIAKARY